MAGLVDIADEESPPVDMHVLSIPEGFIYKVPPLRSASGHRYQALIYIQHILEMMCITHLYKQLIQ
jgi:hypothetical protein